MSEIVYHECQLDALKENLNTIYCSLLIVLFQWKLTENKRKRRLDEKRKRDEEVSCAWLQLQQKLPQKQMALA